MNLETGMRGLVVVSNGLCRRAENVKIPAGLSVDLPTSRAHRARSATVSAKRESERGLLPTNPRKREAKDFEKV